jgi:hypothetical protein
MKSTAKIYLVNSLLCLLAIQVNGQQTSKYKCLLQMSNYMGEGAYIVVSLINP